MTVRILTGDARDVLATLAPASIHAIVTSPPYAEQRKGLYAGVPEVDYPAWTVAWMEAARPALAPGASVFVNIREHVKGGQISDYVHRTRLAVRAAGWAEIDELIWVKPDAPPLGHPGRPRRSWERVLWFAASGKDVRCYPLANGRASAAVGMNRSSKNIRAWTIGGERIEQLGTARCRDVVDVAVHTTETGVRHSAVFPPPLAAWLIQLATLPGDTVCDPFGGSGTTGLAADRLGRHAVLIDLEAAFTSMAGDRITSDAPLFAEVVRDA